MRQSLLALCLLLSLAACQPALPAASALPLTGAAASRLGAAALTVQEDHTHQTFSITPVNAATGKPVPDAPPVQLGSLIMTGFSRDRSQMVFIARQTDDCPSSCLHRLDLRSWSEAHPPLALGGGFGAWFLIPAFDAHSSTLPVILNKETETSSVVQLVDTARGQLTHKTSLPANIMQATYTPSGALAVYGIQTDPSAQESLAYVALLDGADLHVRWAQAIREAPFMLEWAGDHSDPTKGKYLNPAAAFSADGSRLVLAAADEPLLVTVDFQQRAIHTARVQPRTSLLDRLMALVTTPVYAKMMNGISKTGVLSADGRTFYVVGQETTAVKNDRGEYDMHVTYLGLQVIDTRDGTLLRTQDTQANNIALDLDGKTLLLSGWREVPGGSGQAWTDVLDTATGQVRQQVQGTVLPTRLLDGSLAWLVTETNLDYSSTVDIYRPGQAQPLSQLASPGYLDGVAVP